MPRPRRQTVGVSLLGSVGVGQPLLFLLLINHLKAIKGLSLCIYEQWIMYGNSFRHEIAGLVMTSVTIVTSTVAAFVVSDQQKVSFQLPFSSGAKQDL